MFDFDTPVNRKGTHAEKYTSRKRLFGREDVLPLWVADMDFAVAPAIREALAGRADHPIYGYTSVPRSVYSSIARWNCRRNRIEYDASAITLVPGVMSAVAAAILRFSEPGDRIVVQTPLYPPLVQAVTLNDRELVENRLVIHDDHYTIDFGELEQLFQSGRPKMMLFCSPHNPVGRVWTSEEVSRILQLTEQYGVLLVSDEIHSDIVFPPHIHTAVLAPQTSFHDRVILLGSVSKSFNVAGLQSAYALIVDRGLRKSFRRQLRRMNLHGINLFGMTAVEAAYTGGEKWLDALLQYLLANRQYVEDAFKSEMPSVRCYSSQGTFLSWIDFSGMGLTADEIATRLIYEAGVGMNDGRTFSTFTAGFWRLNFALPREMLARGMERIVQAFVEV